MGGDGGVVAVAGVAQAAIGPGMAVYTRYARVLDASGKPVSVREALALITRTLDETLAKQEGDFDTDGRWAPRVVRAARVRRGRVRGRRNALQGEEHQRRRAGPGWRPHLEGRQGPAPEARGASRGPGSGHRPEADRLGGGPSTPPHPRNRGRDRRAGLVRQLGGVAGTARERTSESTSPHAPRRGTVCCSRAGASSGAVQAARKSRRNSGRIRRPWPGVSGAVTVPRTGFAHSTQRSSRRPMSSRTSPFGIDAMSWIISSG